MDFGLSEEQQELAALTRRILEDTVTHDYLTELEARDGERFDPDLYAGLAKANILGIALPEEDGGSGYGIVEQSLVLAEVGRTLAPVPVLASIVTGAMPIARFGSAAQRSAWVRPALEGEKILTAALAEPLNRTPEKPATTARRDGDRWIIDGVKTAVPAGTIADLIVVPATVDDGTRLFLVEPGDEAVTVTPQRTTNRETHAYVELDGVRIGEDGVIDDPDALEWTVRHSTLGMCATQLGVCERALESTAAYARDRNQFERPIGSFQAVQHRLADCYIDVEGIRLTLWQAAWALSAGHRARAEVASAKYWAAEGGHRVAHAAVHVHGGMGVAVEYHIHRYFIHAKQIEFMLGGATEQARRIGDELALRSA